MLRDKIFLFVYFIAFFANVGVVFIDKSCIFLNLMCALFSILGVHQCLSRLEKAKKEPK